MKLQILVNHYKEDESVVKRFLSSLQTQQNVDFEVFLYSDGGGVRLDESIMSDYAFKITYKYLDHNGVCPTRNRLMDDSSTEYIMFCDCDDEFSKEDGLWSLVSTAERTHTDIIGSPYFGESIDRDGSIKNIVYNKDTVRLHGKIFKRKYLYDNNIRFPEELETSGDMSFLWLAYALSNSIIWVDNNFYIWKHNANSVTRAEQFSSVKYFDRTILCFDLLADDLKERNRPDLFRNLVTTTISTMYVESTHPYWFAAPLEYQQIGNNTIHRYLKKYYSFYKDVNEKYRKSKYDLMLNYKHADGLSGEFEGMCEWAEKYLSNKYFSDVLIVGHGVVGSNLEKELSSLYPDIYDKYKLINTKRRGYKYKIAFICVDTPKTEDSVCDTTEVIKAIKENDAEIYVIKSTVLPETTKRLSLETGKRLVFSPEYYGGTQHCNNYNFDFTILGGDKKDCCAVIQILQDVYDARHQFRITDSTTAELAKYMENSYLAMKVSFCNQFYNIAETAGVDYEELRELFVLDPRVEPSHTFVYEDHPYWDSHCLNKDVSAVANYFNAPLLKSVIDFNQSQKENCQKE